MTDVRVQTNAHLLDEWRQIAAPSSTGGAPHHTWAMRLWATARGQQGIQVVAKARVNDGATPVDSIQLRFVQNITNYMSLVWTDPPPPIRVPPFRDPRCRLPLIDTFRNDPPPFYRPVRQQGRNRTVRMTDSPNQIVLATYHDGARTTGVEIEYAFELYLGCTVNDELSSFETLRRVSWDARLAGQMVGAPPGASVPYAFRRDRGWVGTRADPVSSSPDPPTVMGGRTFNQCARGR